MMTINDTSAEFLAELGRVLEVKDAVDVNLAHILTTHLFKADPAKDAVMQAKAAILKLAVERATALKEGGHG